ncbi:MAG: hypothetical protein FWE57_10835 [Chitinispirillia bacterium]|nr:hypothetical protein [Chitinispirillia bacterium]
MTTIQIVLVLITASVIGFIILSNKKSAGICAKCGAKSEALKNVDNQLVCEKCSELSTES